MTEAGKKVLAGFVRLSDADRSEVVTQMNEFINATLDQKRRELKESFCKSAGVILGPVGSCCPCCGR